MTDVDGALHHTTVAPGKLNGAAWNRQLQRARAQLPPQFVEILEKTVEPFVQKIMEVTVPRCVFWDGKMLLVGDAAFGVRPHTGSSTDQAAFQALNLAELLRESMNIHQWESTVLCRGMELHRAGVQLGVEIGFGIPSA